MYWEGNADNKYLYRDEDHRTTRPLKVRKFVYTVTNLCTSISNFIETVVSEANLEETLSKS